MAETSWAYDCDVGGDAKSITQEDWARSRLNRLIDRTVEGVIYTKHTSYSSLLLPSNPAGNTVRIANGAANVNGFEYYNTADVDFDVSGGAAAATDLIVLRSTPASGLVRLALVRGPGGGTATVTQTGVTWEIALAQVLLDGAGNFSVLTDVRVPAATPGSMVKLDEQTGGAAFTGIPLLFRSLKIVMAVSSTGCGGPATDRLELTFNSVVTGTYTWQTSESLSAGVTVTRTSGDTSLAFAIVSCDQASILDPVTVDIMHYTNATAGSAADFVSLNSQSTAWVAGGASMRNTIAGGYWLNVSVPVTSIQFQLTTGGFEANTIMQLYGLA